MSKWKGVVVLLVIAALVIWGLLHLSEIVNLVQGKYTAWKTQRQIEALQKPYLTDKIGGRTPEETFDMFISALKAGDTDLASKYFVLKKQESWRKTLGEYEKKSLLANFVLELENTKKTWRKGGGKNEDMVEFNTYIKVENGSIIKFQGQDFPVDAGSYLNVTRFEKYPTGVWKINLL